MRGLRRTTFCCVVALVVPLATKGQPTDTLRARFQQELETRRWLLNSGLRQMHGPWEVRFQGQGELTERTLPGYENQWKDEVVLDLAALHSLGSHLQLALEGHGQRFQDRAARRLVERNEAGLLPFAPQLAEPSPVPVSGQDSRIQRAALRGGMQYRNPGQLELRLLAGMALDRQQDRRGEGLSLSSGFAWQRPFRWEGEVTGDGWLNQYDERRNHRAMLATALRSDFGEASNYLSAGWDHRRNDIVLVNNGNITRRMDSNLRLDNRLRSPLGDAADAFWDLNFRRADIGRELVGDTADGGMESRELDFRNRVSVRGSHRQLGGRIAYSYGVEDREYAGDLVLGRRQVLEAEGSWEGRNDTLSLAYAADKIAFDSPAEDELSDRDRLVHRVELEGGFWLREGTRLSLNGLVLLDHLVYLAAERSADNRWNRVFRLRPGVDWEPLEGWHNRAAFEVIANYTAFDFEAGGGELRSNVVRRWSAADTLRAPLGPARWLLLSVRHDIEDRGRLHWEEFTQERSGETRAWYLSGLLEHIFWNLLAFQGGYHWQERIEDQFQIGVEGETVTVQARRYRAAGPILRITTRGRGSLQLRGEARLTTIDDSQRDGSHRQDNYLLELLYRW